ncbi:MAG: ABC transporter ATP-binding protein [Deltaproteobacteria bacterium]|nr:ABC transporter ATP-binding protein [Deltaproteobacteria bacterium]
MEKEQKNIIEVYNLHKRFGGNIVYQGATLSVKKGEVLTLIGGSGCGKSVMLKHLIGLLCPDEGKILFDGQDITLLSEKEFLPIRKRIAMLFQGGALFDSLSTFENIAYPLQEHTNLSSEEIRRKVKDVLELVGLDGKQNVYPHDLSGGMKKRVGLARAIVLEPEVVLFDEPTTGLDPYNTRKINEAIINLNKEKKMTCLIVTHDMPSTFEVTDRIAMVHEGRIIIEDQKEKVKENDIVRSFITGEKVF